MNQDNIDLLQQYLDDVISPEDFDRLQSLLRSSAEARRLLRDLATVDSKLTDLAAANPTALHLFQCPAPQPAGQRTTLLWPYPLAAALVLIAFLAAIAWRYSPREPHSLAKTAAAPVRAAVIGALTNMSLWDTISERFERATGHKVYVTYTGDHGLCEDAFRKGRADLLVIHAGDEATKLVDDGFGVSPRPWAYTEMVIAGPKADPAGIRGFKNGADALKRIAATESPYFSFQGTGSQEVAGHLWKAAGLENPAGPWVLKDENQDKKAAMRFAQDHGAYVIIGRLPVHSRKLPEEKMSILVKDDPAMRRTFIAMEANAQRFPNTNSDGARALAEFLISPEIQKLLSEFGVNESDGAPYFPPVQPPLALR